MNQPEKKGQDDQEDKKAKTGVIPNQDLEGSDADKAYDEHGDFVKTEPTASTQKGSDADPDKQSS